MQCVCVCVCVCACMRVCVCVCALASLSVYVCAHVHVCSLECASVLFNDASVQYIPIFLPLFSVCSFDLIFIKYFIVL